MYAKIVHTKQINIQEHTFTLTHVSKQTHKYTHIQIYIHNKYTYKYTHNNYTHTMYKDTFKYTYFIYTTCLNLNMFVL